MPSRPIDVNIYGPKLRAARERAELSQRALGLLVGLDQTTLCRWEGRTTRVLTSTADRLAVALGVSRAALIDLRDCAWCGLPQERPANPLLRIGDEWAHRVTCFDAMTSAKAGVR